jgi:hypothetical protein
VALQAKLATFAARAVNASAVMDPLVTSVAVCSARAA